jgi:hypothetical protein
MSSGIALEHMFQYLDMAEENMHASVPHRFDKINLRLRPAPLRVHVDPIFIARAFLGGSSSAPSPTCMESRTPCSDVWQQVHAACLAHGDSVVVSKVKAHGDCSDRVSGKLSADDYAGNTREQSSALGTVCNCPGSTPLTPIKILL